jgi:hypothetical protein
VVVSNAYGSVTSAVARLSLVAGPPNDAFANRLPIPGGGGTVTGLNLYATREPGEPVIDGNAGGSSVWWTWTAPFSGTANLSTSGSSFDTLFGVYTGSAVSNLSWSASGGDDQGVDGYLGSAVTFAATAGTTYQITVDGYNGATGAITLTLHEVQAASPIVLSAALQGRQVVFSFSAAIGNSYALQYANRLPGAWSVLTNITASATNVVLTDSVTNSPTRFYRVADVGN